MIASNKIDIFWRRDYQSISLSRLIYRLEQQMYTFQQYLGLVEFTTLQDVTIIIVRPKKKKTLFYSCNVSFIFLLYKSVFF